MIGDNLSPIRVILLHSPTIKKASVSRGLIQENRRTMIMEEQSVKQVLKPVACLRRISERSLSDQPCSTTNRPVVQKEGG